MPTLVRLRPAIEEGGRDIQVAPELSSGPGIFAASQRRRHPTPL
jgi:hypothetical protein